LRWSADDLFRCVTATDDQRTMAPVWRPSPRLRVRRAVLRRPERRTARLPSGTFPANAAWLFIAAIAQNLTRTAGRSPGRATAPEGPRRHHPPRPHHRRRLHRPLRQGQPHSSTCPN